MAKADEMQKKILAIERGESNNNGSVGSNKGKGETRNDNVMVDDVEQDNHANPLYSLGSSSGGFWGH